MSNYYETKKRFYLEMHDLILTNEEIGIDRLVLRAMERYGFGEKAVIEYLVFAKKARLCEIDFRERKIYGGGKIKPIVDMPDVGEVLEDESE